MQQGHRWIASPSEFTAAVRELEDLPRIAFDTEFMRVSTLLPKLALLQVQGEREVLLFDPLALEDLAPLEDAFADPRPKVAHSVSEDLIALATRMPAPMGALFDTQIAAAFTGFGSGIGYQALVREALGVELPKDQTRSDWTRRPLQPLQLDYAAADVSHLGALHDLLGERLQASGRLTWCEEECRRLVAGSSLRPAVAATAHWKFPGAWRLDSDAQARLRRLLVWREETAWNSDRPRPWILDDAIAMQLVTQSKWTSEAIGAAVRGLRAFPRSETANVAELLAAVVSSEERAAVLLAPRPADRETEKRTQALRDAVAVRAAELQLPPALLASRRLIDAAIAGTDTEELRGWRAQALGDLLATHAAIPVVASPAPAAS